MSNVVLVSCSLTVSSIATIVFGRQRDVFGASINCGAAMVNLAILFWLASKAF